MIDPTDLASRVESFLHRYLGKVEVSDLTRLPGGASRETWVATIATANEKRRLVLRRDPPSAVLSGDRSTEFELLKKAAEAGVPVPEVLFLADGTDDFGAPAFFMEFVEGETIARKILRDPQYAGALRIMASQSGEMLARLHSIEGGAVASLDPPKGNPGLEAVDRFESLLDSIGEAHPVLEVGLRWLRGNPPEPQRIGVVHGDFRFGNFIVGPEGIRAVLDWELAHLGDPWEDLGWLLVRAWRFGAPGEVGGFGERRELYSAYEKISGIAVDEEAVEWWEVFGTVKWAVICLLQSLTHLSGRVRSVELAAIGRRAAEAEYDMMLLLNKVG